MIKRHRIGRSFDIMKTHHRQYDAGFTAIEMVVSLAIIVLIGAQIMISFSGLGQGVTLNRAAQEVVGEIRKAQYGSLAVTYTHLPVNNIPAFILPPAIGVRLSTTTPQQIIRFTDRGTLSSGSPDPDFPTPPDGKCTNAVPLCFNELIGTYNFPGAIRINRLLDQDGTVYAVAHILFQTPEATLTLTKDDGTPVPGNRLLIELANGTGAIKTITVQVTGEINAQ